MAGVERGARDRWRLAAGVAVISAVASIVVQEHLTPVRAAETPHTLSSRMFAPSQECMSCHNGLTSASGEDISIGVHWRASMMAHSARDPYWQASVRRETIDHPSRAARIEDECATCHMPMSRARARAAGQAGSVFAHLPVEPSDDEDRLLAADGVSCTLCHQITDARFGDRESFVGNFMLNVPGAGAARAMFGPFAVDAARASVMRSVTGMVPTEGKHVQQSELCATCHTLITEAFGANGEVVGSIPEQVPYQEWRHSAYRNERSCQSCHMPVVEQPARMASVLGDAREGLRRHTFFGGNFFMLRMLNRYRTELGVPTPAHELDAAANGTLRQLAAESAALTITPPQVSSGEISFDVDVTNITGHKLPTGYPSRRAWLHVVVRDSGGRVLFESGAIDARGIIAGNDNDADGSRFEPHYVEIRRPDQVQIYEPIIVDVRGMPTTGLLQAVGFAKDNRLLPRGFDKATAERDIAVYGNAANDPDFKDPGDRVRYVVSAGAAPGPFTIAVALRYQPIGFRWADNLRPYESAAEPRRFVKFYDAMASASSTVLAQATVRTGAAAGGQ